MKLANDGFLFVIVLKNVIMNWYLYSLMLLVGFFSGCYSFKGISIPPEIERYDLPYVEIQTGDAPVGINQDFQEKMIEKISRESNLIFDDENPDIIISCAITRYSIDAIAPTANDVVESSRLNITIDVNYEDMTNDENSWTKKFTKNSNFPSTSSFQSIQSQLNEEIFDLLVEDIFNTAFTNW